MSARLCPKCGAFALKFVPGAMPKDDAYVCQSCHARIPASELSGVPLDENTMQRFPNGSDATPSSPLGTFMERKKQ